jgi:hypothetical protein
MKYSGIIGIIATAALIFSCTLTWITVPGFPIRISGFASEGLTLFGRPGKLHLFFGVIAAAMFLIPRLWAKRINVFVCAINLAWALANFYRIGVLCRNGDCPQRHAGIYLLLVSAMVMFVMCLLPKLEVKAKR